MPMLKYTLTIAASLILPLSSFGQSSEAPPKETTAKLVKKPAAAKEAKKTKAAKEAKKNKSTKSAAPKKEAPPAKAVEAKASPANADAKELERLTLANSLTAEKHKEETAGLQAEIAKLKLEKELFAEKLATASLKKSAKHLEELVEHEVQKAKLTREATVAKLELETLGARLKTIQTRASLETTELEGQIREIETRKKREAYADANPQYLDNPLKKDGTLVISDRRISFNGPVTSNLANEVTTKINYYNNKDPKKPIFIVIDDSPGGSVMAGYRILKAMEGSQAPVYVVVKSFAASMAACITTLAEKSFAYPNAIILHHQISSSYMFTSMNLTDHKEAYDDMKRWWHRLADPISAKMGITSDEFIEQMYERTKSGDWTEFGDEAKKLKWVDTIVSRIHETSLLVNPDAKRSTTTERKTSELNSDLTPGVDEKGNPVMFLPRRNPKDVYFMHNPDGYYRFR
jgi:ATP-dependent Clp protease protease subunit